MHRILLAALLVSCLVRSAAGASPPIVSSAGQICPTPGVPCIIDADYIVSDGSTLDFRPSDVVIKAGRKLDIGNGTVTIEAKSLTLAPSAGIFGRGLVNDTGNVGGNVTITTTGGISLQSSNAGRARIDVSANILAGDVKITAGGDVTLDGIIGAQGAGSAGSGGQIDVISQGSITIGPKGAINAFGGGDGDGGDVDVEAHGGGVAVNGPIDSHGGGDAGSIVVGTFGGDPITVSANAILDVSSTGEASSAGLLTLTAGGNLDVEGEIDGEGAGSGPDGGSDGGDLTLTSLHGDVRVNATVTVNASAPDGDGGSIGIESRDLTFGPNGTLMLRARGPQGTGGDLSVVAHRDGTLGPVDLRGGEVGAGEMVAAAAGTLTVVGTIQADATGGPGGSLTFIAETLAVSGEVHAGGQTGGSGGQTRSSACTLNLAPTAIVTTRPGAGGLNILTANGQMSLFAGSSLLAGATNQLVFRPGRQPVTLGTIDPAPTLTADPTLPLCANERPPHCGDGHVDAAEGEDCDDGNLKSCDGCSETCRFEPGVDCGDGVVNYACGEVCDDGNKVGCDGCSADCHRIDNVCGDGTKECGEACDDGNTLSCDAGGCAADCTRPDNHCGDGITECGEECDDGANNGKTGDQCDATCHLRPLPTCGDGKTDPGEDCDFGAQNGCSGCSTTCHIQICGNNVIDCSGNEECDDGNRAPCDGCSLDCKIERCGNGRKDCGEQCDDGNDVNGDGCDDNCTITACGNGIKSGTEQCDDGNLAGGDGCSDTCHIEVACPPPLVGFCNSCTTDLDCDGGVCNAQQCQNGACVPVQPPTCDDGRRDTRDRCVPTATGAADCVHDCLATSACDDGDVCTGNETCHVADGTCVAGTPLDCDDHDACTTDSCDKVRGCQHPTVDGFPGVDCRLSAIDDALLNAGPTDVLTSIRKKIGKGRLAAGAKVRAALAAQSVGNAKKERKALNAAKARIAALEKLIGKAQVKNRISGPLGDALLVSTGGATDAMQGILDAITTARR